MDENAIYDLYRSANRQHINEQEISRYNEYKSKHTNIAQESFITDSQVRWAQGLSISLHPIYSLPNYHTHSYLEIMYVIKGEFINIIEGEITLLRPGDVCFIPPGVYHSLDTVDDDPSESYLLNICVAAESGTEILEDVQGDNSEISAYIKMIFQEARYPKYALIRCGDFNNLNCLILTMHCIYLTNPESRTNEDLKFYGSHDILRRDIAPVSKKLLCCAISYAALKGGVYISDKYTKTAIPASMILKYIKTHYTTVTLEELSEKYSYSFSHTSRLIKQLTGTNFSKILTKTRIEEACRLLTTTKHSVSEISSQTGYGSVEHFNRTFKAETGMSPTEYRRTAAKGGLPDEKATD